jgi:Zn-dependent protease with chaperone function
MDFFARQQQVRRMSSRLVILFVVAVVGIVLTVDLGVVLAFNAWRQPGAQLGATIAVASLLTLAAIGLAALFRTAALRGGGGRVARELGGQLVPPDTTDPRLRRLRNVVEEVAIASGVPVPEVYVLPGEQGINAFAAGWSTSDAAVAVTEGAMEQLNRDELQGVIAHEFSHVVNGDMRLNIRLMGLLFGILFLTVIGRMMLQTGFFGGGRRRDGKGGNPLPLVGLVLVVAGFIGVVAGRLIKASVSRQREYLADASAVQFTRQTSGIAGALKKIAGLPAGSKLDGPRAEEVGHMLFGAGLRLGGLFATHPPLVDRIRALEPSFDPAELTELSRRWGAEPPSGLAEDAALGLAGPALGLAGPAAAGLPAPEAREAVDARTVVARVATPSEVTYRHAEALLGQLPDELAVRARQADHVVPLVLGLLLAEDPGARAAQHAVLAERLGPVLADAAAREAEVLAGLHPLLRLPLAQLCFPALRSRPLPEQEAVLGAVFALIHSDGRITTFEYCLSRMLYSELAGAVRPRARVGTGTRTMADDGAAAAAATLLAVLAQAGHPDPDVAESAFHAAVLRTLPGRRVPYVPPDRGVLALEQVWSTLDSLAPADTSLLVQGAVEAIGHDGVLTVVEMELLRTVCAVLRCPLPPQPAALQR